MKRSAVFLILGIAIYSFSVVRAEEGGTGHYLPGSIASFADGVPADTTFIARLNVIYYDGSFGHSLPIAGTRAASVEAESFALGLTLVWRPPLEIGKGYSYAFGVTVPFVFLDVAGDVETDQTTMRRSDSASGLGDIMILPVMLSHALGTSSQGEFRIGAYAPTGSYEVGHLANTGKNFWTIEPTLGYRYLGQKNGREVSIFAGMDFNSGNDATDYHTGTQAHLESTLAQHFPLAKGLAGAGLSGYWYEQVTGDSGSGAIFGDFKGRTVGFGPAVSFTKAAASFDWLVEFKWLHEFETRNRLEGDYLWLKVLGKF